MSASISSASTNQDRAELRRWWFSAMLAVAVHGVAAMAVLTWHITSRPFDSHTSLAAAPFFIDLEPLPDPPSAEQRLPPQEAGLDGGAAMPERASSAAEAGNAANRNSGAESVGLQRNAAGTRANGPIMDAPIVPAPPDNAERDAGGASAAASHAFAAGPIDGSPVNAGHAGRVDPGPIDTSITVSPSLHQRKAFGAFDRSRMILLRPNAPGAHDVSVHDGSAHDVSGHGVGGHGSLAHGPGAHVQDRVNAAIERDVLRRTERPRNGSAAPATNSLGINSATSTSVRDNAKNAIGAATPNSDTGNPTAGVVNGIARNAIGIATEVHPSAHGSGVGDRREGVAGAIGRTGVLPSSAGLKTGAPPPGLLNGRGMARPGMSLTALGGPPKNVPDVLNGSDIHSKLGTRYGP